MLRIVCFGVSLLLASCSNTAQNASPPSPEEQLAHIDALQASVLPDGPTGAPADTADAYPFIRAVQGFAEAHPRHPRAAPLLMDAAGLANGTQWSNKAFQLWGLVWRAHPDYARAPEAMFYQGFVADTQFGADEMATAYYDRLIRTYPDTEYARQAAQLRAITSGEAELPPVPEPPAATPN